VLAVRVFGSDDYSITHVFVAEFPGHSALL
jgi:hypothetical protein